MNFRRYKDSSFIPVIHYYWEGFTPYEYRSRGTEEIKRYKGEIRNKKVDKIDRTPDGEFRVYAGNERVTTKAVV